MDVCFEVGAFDCQISDKPLGVIFIDEDFEPDVGADEVGSETVGESLAYESFELVAAAKFDESKVAIHMTHL